MTKRTNDIGAIHPLFIPTARAILADIVALGLPFKVFETHRSAERQAKVLKDGKSKAGPGQSPHNYGLAMDLVLDSDKIKVKSKEWRGKLYPWAWDNETPECVRAWFALGEVARKHGATWGGDWSPRDESGLGWDYAHIEFTDWRNFMLWRDK